MATLTSTAAASGVPIKANHVGVQAASVSYNSGATAFSASATTVLLVKVPHGARVVGILQNHSTGAATSPMDIGVDSSLSKFATALTQGAASIAMANLPYDVSVSDDATSRFKYIKGTVTVGTTTASLIVNMTVLYHMI